MKTLCTCAKISKKMNDAVIRCLVCEIDWESLRK